MITLQQIINNRHRFTNVCVDGIKKNKMRKKIVRHAAVHGIVFFRLKQVFLKLTAMVSNEPDYQITM